MLRSYGSSRTHSNFLSEEKMTTPHDEWLTKHHAKLRQALEEIARHEPYLEPLVLDAMAHGRMIRSVLALKFLEWRGWNVEEADQDKMFNNLARIELVHSASCILDDIIDGDTVRRGIPSFHIRNGLAQGILTASLMLVLSLSRSKDESDDVVQTEVVRTMRNTVVGEAWDSFLTSSVGALPANLAEQYMMKTTPSFAATHAIVALAAKRDPREVAEARDYGVLQGTLYQTANDYYDTFHIPDEVRGKVGDTVLVTLSVPICFLLEKAPEIKALLGRTVTKAEYAHVREQLAIHGIDPLTRGTLDSVKEQIRASFPVGEVPVECVGTIEAVDSLHFWSYKYVSK